MTSLTADRGDHWTCSCGNDSGRDGFTPSTEDGEDCPIAKSRGLWHGHYRCNGCLFVFTAADLIREA